MERKEILHGRSDKGATMAEYVLLVALIAAVALVAVRQLGLTVGAKWEDTTNSVTAAMD